MDRVFVFGENKNLFGIYSEIDNEANKSDILVLILNSGLVHRPGPFRMNNEFSIYLAENGIESFRFDLSGIGDSEKNTSGRLSFKEQNLFDVGEAIEFIINNYPSKKIVLMGLCTGADLAHRATVKYSEVIGTIMLDGYGYPTKKFLTKRYLPILTSYSRIVNLISSIVSKVFSKGNDSSAGNRGADAYIWELPSKSDYISDMEALFEKGNKHLYIYTSGVRTYYNYKEQFSDTFKNHDFRSSVHVEYFEYSDHVYILQKERIKLFESVLTWLKKIS